MCDARCPDAVAEAVSKGRMFPEPPHPYRSGFERDRDRIIPSSAFRRREGKTQVFSPGLEESLVANLYHHPILRETADKVKYWLAELLERLCREPDLMPAYFQGFIPAYGLQRAVCDYLAGMTDRYCLKVLGRVDSCG